MKKYVKSILMIVLGSVIYGLAFDCFFAPNKVALGGITGLAQIINVLLPVLPVGVMTILLNTPLFFAGWRLLGFRMLATSLLSMIVCSLAIDGIAMLYAFHPMDPMLAALCGGALMGLGLGLVFAEGATTGGTDIVARLLKLKFAWLPLGKLVMVPDCVVLMLAIIAFGQVESALYGVVALFVSTRVMDTVLYGLDTSKVAYIISDSWQQIAEELLSQDRGITILQGQGAYTGMEKQVLLVAFKKKGIVQVKRTVHEIDPRAFLIVCDAHDVLGEGFGEYQKEEI